MRQSDVYLDTIGLSGFNTAMQAVECVLPIVTCDGRFMRGRLASDILKRMGLDEMVAVDKDAYVDLAVRLCQDVDYREEVARRMELRRPQLETSHPSGPLKISFATSYRRRSGPPPVTECGDDPQTLDSLQHRASDPTWKHLPDTFGEGNCQIGLAAEIGDRVRPTRS